jgi:hypothetical protein
MEAKGYNLSTDYTLLWDLIHKGYRVPAWILYSDKYDEPIFDLVEVKITKYSKTYDIGTRGRSYSGFEGNVKDFVMNCESLQLKFIQPHGT